MQGGRHADPGSLQEELDTLNYIVPGSNIEVDFEDQPVMDKMTILGLTFAVVLPSVFTQFAFSGMLGSVILLVALFRKRRLDGWFKAALAIGVAVMVLCVAKTVWLGEMQFYDAREMMKADPILSGVSLMLLAALTVAIWKKEAQTAPWLVLALVAFCVLFGLGYAGSGQWVFAAKPAAGLLVIFAYYRVYKTI